MPKTPPPPAHLEYLMQHLLPQLASASHGQRSALIAHAAAHMRVSPATVYRWIGRHTTQAAVRASRRPRSDAGQCQLSRDEALHISAVMLAAMRKNDKLLMNAERAAAHLREAGRIRAERIDAQTGEVCPLSASTIERALRHYRLHPSQLLRPMPATELRSPHPNHTWQIDASLCVLYYLKGGRKNPGLRVLDADRFYKNKPAAIERVAAERVWRYVVTDHRSGAIFVHYVLGAESGQNLARAFISAIHPRPDGAGGVQSLHGVPLQLMMDMGSANTSGLFRNLARRLGVRLLPHAPGNARATGQVEKAQDIVERQFESQLRFCPVDSLDALNHHAQLWAARFNTSAIHSRHGQTRAAVWQTITPEQLRSAPTPEVCAQLMSTTPELRTVSPTLSVQFAGREWDVRGVSGVLVGEKVLIATNPWQPDAACLIGTGEDGRETLTPIPAVQRDDAGQRLDAPIIGGQFAAIAPSALQHNLREVESLIWGQDTARSAPRRAGRIVPPAQAVPFAHSAGPLEPLAATECERQSAPLQLPRRGQAAQVWADITQAAPPRPTLPTAPLHESQPLNLFELAAHLARHLGRALNAHEHQWLRTHHASGADEGDVPAIARALSAPQLPIQLRVVSA